MKITPINRWYYRGEVEFGAEGPESLSDGLNQAIAAFKKGTPVYGDGWSVDAHATPTRIDVVTGYVLQYLIQVEVT